MHTGELVVPAFKTPLLEAIFWRGLFVHRYSGVEHTVTELLLRAGGRAEYQSFGELPYPWSKKLKRLSSIIDAPGPLQSYADELRSILTPLTGIERHRHQLVHGLMSLHPRKDEPRMLFIKSHDWIDGACGEVAMWITIDQLVKMTQDVVQYADNFIALVARIFEEHELMPISVGERTPMDTSNRSI